jgi:hypothetical protein
MKKLLVLILCITGTYVSAQEVQQVTTQQGMQQQAPQQQVAPQHKMGIRLHAYTTYAFDDNGVDSYYSEDSYFDGSIKGGFEYGGGLEIKPAPHLGVEITYLRLDSKAPMDYYLDGVQSTEFNLAQNLLFLSVNKYLPLNSKLEPYAAMQIGMDIINVENPDNGKSEGATKFAWGIKLGSNIWVSETVGIKIQAGLLSAVQAIGGGVYFGTGGAGAGFTGLSTYYQFNLGGGLVFNLSGRK